MKKSINIMFIFLFCLPFFLFCISFFFEKTTISVSENRVLNEFPSFDIKNAFLGYYQSGVELVIPDQILFSEELKQIYKTTFAKFNKDIVFKLFNYKNQYVCLTNEICLYGDSGYLVQKIHKIEDDKLNYYKNIYNYQINVEGVKKYIYFINKDNSIDFNNKSSYNKYNEIIKNNFIADKYGFFNIYSFEEYKKYFYQADHHWNNLGSYKGYTEIIKLLNPNDKVVEPIKLVKYSDYFNGSYARFTTLPISTDGFYVYEFPKFKCKRYMISDGEYIEQELSPIFPNIENDIYYNYYGAYYSNYESEVYDTFDESKDNLLVISTSFVQPIKLLLVRHFNRTHFVDIRYDESKRIKDYLNNYIRDNDIDKVLIIGDISSFGIFE